MAFKRFVDGDSKLARGLAFCHAGTFPWKTPRKFNQFAFEWRGIAISVTGWPSHK